MMTLSMDPELGTALVALTGGAPAVPAPAGDWKTLRAAIAATYPRLTAALDVPHVRRSTHETVSDDGAALELHWFAPASDDRDPRDAGGTAAVVHAHGGGRIGGEVDLFAPFIAQYVAASGVPFLSVAYRLAPEHPGSAAGDDLFAGLQWLLAQATDLDVDPRRVAVMGESAGGGLAAATAIRARDAGISLARQLLIYPQLDDRTVDPDPALKDVAASMYTDNETSWNCILGDRRGTDDVPATIVPARLTSYRDLAPAYLEVGSLDIFRDETVRYATRLWADGVDAELHVLPGLIHGWDHFAPNIAVHAGVHARRVSVLGSL